VKNASWWQSWSPDPARKFPMVTSDGTPTNRTHDRQNQLTNVGSIGLGLDANGNSTVDEAGHAISYDAWNRLTSIRVGTYLYTYAYDALGRRISEVKSPIFMAPTTTYRDLYYNADWQVIQETKNANPVTDRHYVWSPAGGDLMVLRDRDADGNSGNGLEERLYVQQDANGNVTALVGLVSGAWSVVERSAEDPYGAVTVLTPNWTTRSASLFDWKYYHQGLRLDGSGTLDDNRERMYSPTLMRFLQNDPAGFAAGDSNTYRYEGNGPVSGSDPSGMEDQWHHLFPRQIWENNDFLNNSSSPA
jgi:RHS repeat-associated protein